MMQASASCPRVIALTVFQASSVDAKACVAPN
jgi:hypothetical protein